MLFINILYYYSIFISNFFFIIIFVKLYKIIFSLKKFSINISFSILLLPICFFIISNFFYVALLTLPICIIYNLEKNFINKILINIISFWMLSFFIFSTINVDLLLYVYIIELISISLFIYMYINILHIINKFINKYYLILFYFFINNFIFSFFFILLLLSSLSVTGSFLIDINFYFSSLSWCASLLFILILIKFGASLVFLYKIDLYKNFNLNNIIVYTIIAMWVYLIFVNNLYIYLFFNKFLNYYKILIFLTSIILLSYTFFVNSVSFYFNISSLLTLNFLTLLICWNEIWCYTQTIY